MPRAIRNDTDHDLHHDGSSKPPYRLLRRGATSVAWRLSCVAALVATLLALTPSSSDGSTCGSDPGDETAIEAAVAAVRAACPCDAFPGRGSFRRCARDRIKAAVSAADLPSRCRATVTRFANRSTCGDAASAVTCCDARSTACAITRSAIACRAWRGGTGLVGKTDWCHDSCPADPTPRPATPTPTPSATPSGPPTPDPDPRCICSCDIPYVPYACLGLHPCVVPSIVPATAAECAAFSAPGRRCQRIGDFAGSFDHTLLTIVDCRL